MKTFSHVSNTWLLAQIFHPLMFVITAIITGEESDIGSFAIIALIFGFIFSLPAYLLCMVFFQPVMQMDHHHLVRLFAWILVVILCIVIGFLFVCITIFDVELFIQEFSLAVPGCLAALLAILCRYRQFINFGNLQIDSYENNRV